MHENNREGWKINKAELGKRSPGSLGSLRKYQREMQQQSRHKHLRDNFDPINLVVEGVQFPAVVEGEKNERHQTKNVEVHGAGRVPAARKNEKPYEKINKADHARIIFNGRGFLGGGSNERGLKLLAVP